MACITSTMNLASGAHDQRLGRNPSAIEEWSTCVVMLSWGSSLLPLLD
jgi:hypothetical protein